MVIDAVALLRAQAPAVAALRRLGLLHGGLEAIPAALVLPRCAGAEMVTERPRQTRADAVAFLVVEILTGACTKPQLSILDRNITRHNSHHSRTPRMTSSAF